MTADGTGAGLRSRALPRFTPGAGLGHISASVIVWVGPLKPRLGVSCFRRLLAFAGWPRRTPFSGAEKPPVAFICEPKKQVRNSLVLRGEGQSAISDRPGVAHGHLKSQRNITRIQVRENDLVPGRPLARCAMAVIGPHLSEPAAGTPTSALPKVMARCALPWRVQIAEKPASEGLGLRGVFIRGEGLKDLTADSAFKRMQVDVPGACWLDADEHHRGLALRTSGALNCGEWNDGRDGGHEGLPRTGGSTILSVTDGCR
jgi:hypothetical protein